MASRESCSIIMTFDELPTFPSLDLVVLRMMQLHRLLFLSTQPTRTVLNQPAHSIQTPCFFSRNRYRCPLSLPQDTHATRTARPIHHLSYPSTTNPYPPTTASPTKTAGVQREVMTRGARSTETAPMSSIRIERGRMMG
jgi:hypothetical protein